MENQLSIIAKEEKGGDIILILPCIPANYGKLVFFDGAHGEMSLAYYQGLKAPKDKEKVEKYIDSYCKAYHVDTRPRILDKLPRNFRKIWYSREDK